MALSQAEKDSLLELKGKGYSFSEAMGFIGSSRMGNTSKVEKDYTPVEVPAPTADDAISDLKGGFEGAKSSFEEGMQRSADAGQRKSLFGKTAGNLGAGFRFAGEALGSIGSGVVRALPGGTTAMNKAEEAIGASVEKAVTSKPAQGATALFDKLPEGVQQTAGDVGNVAMGAVGLAGTLTAPGAGKALSEGLSQFAESGVKGIGTEGIDMSIKTGISPDDLMQRVARVSKSKQAKFEERAGESIGSYLVNRGIFGDPEAITDQLYARMQASKGRVDSGLSKVGGTYKDGTVTDALEQLAAREARVSSPNTPSPDQRRVGELVAKHDGDGLTLSEVNEVKRLYERNVKLDFLRDNVADGVAQANNVDNKLRELVVSKADQGGFSDVKALNKETFLAKQLLDDLGAEYAGQAGNNFMSLSDAIFLAEAASNPAALAAFGLKKTLSSKAALSGVAKILADKRTKQGLPEGNVDGPLGLPEGGASAAPETPATPLPAKTQSTIDSAEQTRVQGQLKPSPETMKALGVTAGVGVGSYFTFGEDGSLIPMMVAGSVLPQGRNLMATELKSFIKNTEKRASKTTDKNVLNRLQKAIDGAKIEVRKLEGV